MTITYRVLIGPVDKFRRDVQVVNEESHHDPRPALLETGWRPVKFPATSTKPAKLSDRFFVHDADALVCSVTVVDPDGPLPAPEPVRSTAPRRVQPGPGLEARVERVRKAWEQAQRDVEGDFPDAEAGWEFDILHSLALDEGFSNTQAREVAARLL